MMSVYGFPAEYRSLGCHYRDPFTNSNLLEQRRRAAQIADKILRGAKPADIPVEQPTNFELVVNRKTAKALGITIPQSVLLHASRVIE